MSQDQQYLYCRLSLTLMIEHQNFFSLALPWNAESDLCCSPQQLSENKFIHTWHIKYSIFFQEVLSMYIYCLSKKSCPFMYTLSYICPRSLDHQLSLAHIYILSVKSCPFLYTVCPRSLALLCIHCLIYVPDPQIINLVLPIYIYCMSVKSCPFIYTVCPRSLVHLYIPSVHEVLSIYIYCLSKKFCPFMYTLSYICPRSLDHLSIYINCLSKKSRPFIYTLSYTCLYYLGANADLARDRFQYSHLLVPVFCCIVVNIAPAVPQELSQAGRYTFTYQIVNVYHFKFLILSDIFNNSA